jgi:HPt (histidine-containing phosphotransfer) domain-containing protein
VKNSKNPNLNSILSDLRSEYLKKFPDRLDLLQKLLDQNDFKLLESEFHKLKGNGQTLGLKWISEVSSWVETQLKRKDLNNKQILIPKIQLTLSLFQKGLKDPFHFKLENEPLWGEINTHEGKS